MRTLKNITWLFTANLIVSLTKWLMLVIIARTLTPEAVGAYSLAFALGAPITLLANMKLRSLYITEEKINFSDYMYTRYIFSLIAFIILFVIGTLIYPKYFLIIMLVGLIKIFDLQSDLYYALPHKKQDMNYIGKLLITKHLNSLLAFLITILFTRDLAISLLVQLIFQILFLFLIEKRKITKIYKPIIGNSKLEDVKRVILLGIPLGLVQMLFSLNTSYSRYLLEFFESAEILGYFSAMAYILTVGNMLVNAVSQNFLPILSKLIKEKKIAAFKKYVFFKLSIFSTLIGVFTILFSYFIGETFLTIVYGIEYAKYTDILILMSFALSINFISWNFDTALLAMRYISVQLKISIIALIANVFIGYFLIKSFGIHGASYTIIIINSIQLLLRGCFVYLRIRRYDI
ncbi:hypothetical protein E2R51_09210 [Jeotgalibacillus sp. S-D1]|uniref:oligosaccharide flippase family protein n=1 Tax=Jeotgalibacillus sp. S-D1 TaxID=2552189 RepID=UPI00105A395C|nr:oligosaccharide flippase family protein [Jeotgalibacillus sp. S-D1]TDL32838.1 hypothetical protein E2R51_09210 [Jeotgalibacillus sp. S-D1]